MPAVITPGSIPTIDVSPYFSGDADAKQAVAAAIDEVCQSVGFLVITGHGVSPALIEELREVTTRFLALPLDVKMRYKMGPEAYRGYAHPGTQSLAASYGVETPPDLKESFSIGPVDVPDEEYYSAKLAGGFFAPNMWPEEVPELEVVWRAYYGEMERLAASLMRLFALALDMPEHFFDDKIDRHITDMSGIHYPPLDRPAVEGQLRGGPHTDFGSLTILLRDQATGGLQILTDEQWVDAPWVPDSFVINIGDLMAEWTNNRWFSNIHRVALPDKLNDPASDRLVFTFFHQPNYDAPIEVLPTCYGPDNPPKYEKTTSGENFIKKLTALRTPELGT